MALLGAWASAAAAGCAARGSGDVAETRAPVINGSADSGNTYSAVAQIAGVGCSAFYIGNRTMITAGHCLEGLVSKCQTFGPSSVAFRFALPDGTVGSAASDAARTVGSIEMVQRPTASFDVSTCPTTAACSTTSLDCADFNCFDAMNNPTSVATQNGITNRSDEFVLVHLDADPPADVKPVKIMVSPNDVAASPKFAAFAGLESWAATNKPLVTFVGFGSGTHRYPPTNQRGRDVGITRWVATQSNFSGALGWQSCTARNPTVNKKGVVIAPDDIFDNQAPMGGPQPVWCNIVDGTPVPGASESHAGCGDSGGPVLAGTGPSFQGVGPDALPAPAAGDKYSAAEHYVVGMASLYVASVNSHPATVYAPTYAPAASAWLAAKLADDDGDQVLNAWDKFPNCDDLGVDSDGDGTPDDCDPCPCDAANSDADHDGVCDVVCPGQEPDNCPLVKNPGQDNCNRDAEIAAGTPLVGDACDAIPCPRATQTSQASGGGGPVHFVSTNFFDVEPIRVPPPNRSETFQGAWGHRFCPCPDADGSTDAPLICAQTSGCTIGGVDFATDGPSWHFTSVGITDPPSLDPTFVDSFALPAELQPGGVPATLDLLALGAGFGFSQGSHWFHVKQDVTCTGILCPPPLVAQSDLDALASHYWAGQTAVYITIDPIPQVPNMFDWWSPPAPDCVVCGVLDVFGFAHVLPEGQLAMRTPAGDLLIEDQVTPAATLAMKTTTGVRWLAPAEPARALGATAVRLASIALDASAVGPALVPTGAGMDLVGAGAVVTPELVFAAADLAGGAAGPSPRSQFGAVLRASEDDLVVIGGLGSNGAPTGDMWRYRFHDRAWSKLTTADGSIVPGAVLAATYDSDTRRLIVLDEVSNSAGGRTGRLWTLGLRGAVQRLASWSRRGLSGPIALGYSHDGSFVLVVGRSGGTVPPLVARLGIDRRGVHVEGLGSATAVGVPASAPRTNQRGIHLIVDGGRAGGGLTAERIDWARLRSLADTSLALLVE
jgi:hypothetical protein